jgi:7,8-dihydropterin-6-yl-methyl-4-(beta-D-ribofuranosyl)aminobenzene 5'-phosphate synthase
VCTESAAAAEVAAALPRPAAGRAADPIALAPADEVVITTLVDNVYDALLTGGGPVTRAPLAAGTAQAPQFEAGRTTVGLMAEHGFAAGHRPPRRHRHVGAVRHRPVPRTR